MPWTTAFFNFDCLFHKDKTTLSNCFGMNGHKKHYLFLKESPSNARILSRSFFNCFFLTKITVKTRNHEHIRDHQVKIYKISALFFILRHFSFYRISSTTILTGCWWRRKMKWNSEPSHNSIPSNFQFQENRIKTVAVRVPVRKHASMAAVTSSNMLMSWITNAHN